MEFKKGKIIKGKFQLIKKLGEGGMGSVWMAKDMNLGRDVAIKKIDIQEILGNRGTPQQVQNLLARAENEGRMMASISHRSVIRIFETLYEDDVVMHIMEFFPFPDLERYILNQQGPLPTKRLVKVFRQILEGTNEIHRKGIIHRDIKPANILITPEDNIKIIDFGISKKSGLNLNLTRTGQMVGSPLYTSPEQISGRPISKQTDIYSLGVLLFTLGTGRPPYDNNIALGDLVDKIVNHPLPDPTRVYPPIDPHIVYLIREATKKDPGRRFRSCTEFLNELNDIGRRVPPVSTPEPLSKPKTVANRNPAGTRKPVNTPGAGTGSRTTVAPKPVENSFSRTVTQIFRPGGEAGGALYLFSGAAILLSILTLIGFLLDRLGNFPIPMVGFLAFSMTPIGLGSIGVQARKKWGLFLVWPGLVLLFLSLLVFVPSLLNANPNGTIQEEKLERSWIIIGIYIVFTVWGLWQTMINFDSKYFKKG